MTAEIGERVARIRAERKLTVQAVADRCAELGVPLGRVTITKLEGGKRQAVTPAELTVLAAVLGAAPIELLYPIGFDERVEILPGCMMDPLETVRWFCGEYKLDLTGERPALRPSGTEEESSVYLLQQHHDYLDKLDYAEDEAALAYEVATAPDADGATREDAVYKRAVADDWRAFIREPLRHIRSEMRRRGMLLPDVPRSLQLGEDAVDEHR
jgi:transcriptional regulator with XRE-family HTH domain